MRLWGAKGRKAARDFCRPSCYAAGMVKIKKHTPEGIPDSGSYGVHFEDGRAPVYFYFDDNAGRRSIRNVDDGKTALEKAKAFARSKRDECQK